MHLFYSNVGKGENKWYHYVFTVLLTILGYAFGQIPMYLGMKWAVNNFSDVGTKTIQEFNRNPDFSLLHIDKNLGLFLILMFFVFALLGLYIGIRFIHKRKFLTLISPFGKIDWKRIIWSTVFWFGLLLVLEIFFYFQNPENYQFRDPSFSFLFLFLISIFVLPLQTAFEEIFTRGYILQSVTYNSKNVFFGFLVSVFIFAMLHGSNPETFKYGFLPMMTYYISAAVLLGLIVVFDKRLELAIGVHTATNMFGAMIVTYKGAALQTDSIFMTNDINPVVLAFEIIVLGIIFVLVSAKKYKWDIKNSFKNV